VERSVLDTETGAGSCACCPHFAVIPAPGHGPLFPPAPQQHPAALPCAASTAVPAKIRQMCQPALPIPLPRNSREMTGIMTKNLRQLLLAVRESDNMAHYL
jgi:hypothetical protein